MNMINYYILQKIYKSLGGGRVSSKSFKIFYLSLFLPYLPYFYLIPNRKKYRIIYHIKYQIEYYIDMTKKKETYKERWNKEHPLIQIRLPKDTYMKIEKLQTILGKHKNDIIKDLINGLVINFDEYKKNIEKDIYEYISKTALYEPIRFYEEFIKPYSEWFILFTTPCSYCGKPIIWTHKSKNDLKRIIRMFANFSHTECKPSTRIGTSKFFNLL